jgi:hypothetical protein
MAMQARRLLHRVSKEFVEVLFWCLVAYAPFGAILVALMGASLSDALAIGGIIATVLAALITVLSVGLGGVGDPHPRYSRPYDYDPGSDPILRSGAGYGAFGGWDGGGWDGGGGGDGGGG